MSRGKGENKRAKHLKYDGPGKNCGKRARHASVTKRAKGKRLPGRRRKKQ